MEWLGGQVVNLGGQELLYYEAPRAIHAALLRGSTADEDGNISFEDEPCYIDSLSQARPRPSVNAPSFNSADMESVRHLRLLRMSPATFMPTRRASCRAAPCALANCELSNCMARQARCACDVDARPAL